MPPLAAAQADVAVLEREPADDARPSRACSRPSPAPSPKSARARSEEEPEFALDPDAPGVWSTPPLSLLQSPSTIVRHHLSTDALEENARMLETVLDDYGVRGEITSIRPGPVVTMYELEPAAGLKASRVIGLADDIARSMSALACRCSTIPGRSVIGIELPNELREKVLLREILAAKGFGDSAHALPLALGKDIGGEPVVANLARMPHLLIAGTTGSGKSVAINTMILSLLYKLSPAECRLIMIDPKMLELSVYDGIPHLLSPVVTDPKKAVVALKWSVAEMEERYRKMSKMGVRNIDGYNARVKDAVAGEAFTRTVQTGFDEETGEPVFETESFQPEAMPFIVVIVDEMADLMMVAGKEIEACIQRLAQMARASGIHLIMATQRPSVDVITGTIKANFPTRISFQVTSKIDSRTILGEMGAEQLLGQGDMLYMAGGGRITRVHGPFVSDEEVEEMVKHLKILGTPDYDDGILDGPDADEEARSTSSSASAAAPVRRRPLRPGRRHRRQGPQVLDLLHPAQALGRLQQGRQARRADGGSRRRLPGQPRRQARGAGAGAVRPGRAHSRRATPTSIATASSFLSRVQMQVPGTSRHEARSDTSTTPMPRPKSRRSSMSRAPPPPRRPEATAVRRAGSAPRPDRAANRGDLRRRRAHVRRRDRRREARPAACRRTADGRPDRRVRKDHRAGRRRGGARRSGSLPPSRARRRALSRSINRAAPPEATRHARAPPSDRRHGRAADRPG